MADQGQQQAQVVTKSEFVHSFAHKLMGKIKHELAKTYSEQMTSADVSHNVKVALLYNLQQQLKQVFATPTSTCAFVHEFLLPHWKDGEKAMYFDAKGIQESQDEEIKKQAQKIITETTMHVDDILTPAFMDKCKEELSFIFRYFEAMCDAYTCVPVQKS